MPSSAAPGLLDRRAALTLAGAGIVSAALPSATAAASGPLPVWSSSLRSLLSAVGQTAFDAAEDGAFFGVSAADYAAVRDGLAGVAARGLSADELLTPLDSNDRFSHDMATSLPPSIGTVPAGSTVVGYALRVHPSLVTTSAVLLAPTYLGTYARVGTTSDHAPGDAVVHLLRRGGAPVGGTRFLAQIGAAYTVNFSPSTGGEGTHWAVIGSFDSAGPDWNPFGSELPVFQALLHIPA